MAVVLSCFGHSAEGTPHGETSKDAQDVSKLAAKLEGEDFNAREAAARELQSMGERARPALEAAFERANPEGRAQIQKLLGRLNARRQAVVYVPDGHVWIANADGSEPRQLTHGGHQRSPRLMPGGHVVLYVESHPHKLWIVGADGKNAKRLTPENESRDEFEPAVSPDGKRIAYSSWNSKAEGPEEEWEVHLMNADGTGRKRVARSARAPSFMPDGKTLIVQGLVMRADLGAVYSHITRIDLEKEGRTDLSGKSEIVDDEVPSVSPDGKSIVFVRKNHIHIMDIDGKNVKDLTPERQGAFFPRFSPDGKRVIFVESGESEGPPAELKVMWTMKTDGTESARFGSGDEPDWGNRSP